MNVGSVVELDKPANANVDVYVNQKLVARGEVVVAEDNFGIRIKADFDLHTVTDGKSQPQRMHQRGRIVGDDLEHPGHVPGREGCYRLHRMD